MRYRVYCYILILLCIYTYKTTVFSRNINKSYEPIAYKEDILDNDNSIVSVRPRDFSSNGEVDIPKIVSVAATDLPVELEWANGRKIGKLIKRYTKRLTLEDVTLILPCHDTTIRPLQREHVRFQAPKAFGRNVYQLVGGSEKMYDYEVNYGVHIILPSDVHPIIFGFQFIKSIRNNVRNILVVDCGRVHYWRRITDTVVPNMNDERIKCMSDKKEPESSAYDTSASTDRVLEDCTVFSGVYHISIVDKILEASPLKLKRFDDPRDWYSWLINHADQHDISLIYDSVSVVVRSDWRAMLMRDSDPKIGLIKDYGPQEQLVRMVYNSLEHRPRPRWLRTGRRCFGDRGVWVVATSYDGTLRREVFRKVFEALNIRDFYFIVGVETTEVLDQLDEEASAFNDILIYDNLDTFDNSTYKAYASMDFVLNFCANPAALIKMNHDVRINPRVFPAKDKSKTFGCPYHQVDFGTFPDVQCMDRYLTNQLVQRYDSSNSVYSYKQWPIDTHIPHCTGHGYIIKYEALGRIYDAARQYAWSGHNRVKFKSIDTNEANLITGYLRALVYADISRNALDTHSVVEGDATTYCKGVLNWVNEYMRGGTCVFVPIDVENFCLTVG